MEPLEDNRDSLSFTGVGSPQTQSGVGVWEKTTWDGDQNDRPRGISEQALAQPQATLVDVLDRVLDRGLVLNADIIISLAGVPLIGINLRAALAGMDTMVRYGLLKEWDRNVRLEGGVEEAFLLPAKSLSGIASTSLRN